MKSVFEGKDILVTGGCGSIGSEIVRQLIKHNPKRVRVFDNSESGHFYLNQSLKSDKIRNLLGDVKDRNRIIRAMEGVDIVFHAAALKHVDLCEYNPFDAVATNVLGTENVVNAAIVNNVERFISISTDKAVNPINTMGATKLLGEKLVVSAPSGYAKTIFSCVRFGNVLDSVGSVIPIFREQIKKGGPVTITTKDMIRFFMTISQAVSLVLKVAETAKENGEVFILKMDRLKISDLAEALIGELAPRYDIDPKKIKIEVIGKRPGEKINELLMSDEEKELVEETEDMFIIHNPFRTSKINANYGSFGDNNKILNKKEILELLKKNKII